MENKELTLEETLEKYGNVEVSDGSFGHCLFKDTEDFHRLKAELAIKESYKKLYFELAEKYKDLQIAAMKSIDEEMSWLFKEGLSYEESLKHISNWVNEKQYQVLQEAYKVYRVDIDKPVKVVFKSDAVTLYRDGETGDYYRQLDYCEPGEPTKQWICANDFVVIEDVDKDKK